MVHRKCVHLVKNVYVNNTDNATTGGSPFPELDEQLLGKDVMNTLNSVINKVVCVGQCWQTVQAVHSDV